ncbi:hypothetical protein QTO34_003617 [Cnephaeus nilssonii]|uniref:Glycine N-acyltransferase-like protein n=1 Tax=Cnephaeus nilssonii TaxID=3371016 RepID=A0AA40LKQ3_CNENI|nr:hypothetical protein QTO34_003617 [Eptesicus nilssonii]
MEDKFDNMSKNQEEMKKNQEEMKNDIADVKNSIESTKSRLEEAEDCISSQSNLNEVIQNLAARKSFKVQHTQCFIFVMLDTVKKLIPSLFDVKNLPPGGGKPKAINQEILKPSSLDVTHAALVNKFWHFGGNERSQRFIERCIQTFPTFCLLGPEGNPVCWNLMDQTGEIRMAGTLPEFQKQGLITYVIYIQSQALNNLGFPVYYHTDKNNKIMQKVSYNLHISAYPVLGTSGTVCLCDSVLQTSIRWAPTCGSSNGSVDREKE